MTYSSTKNQDICRDIFYRKNFVNSLQFVNRTSIFSNNSSECSECGENLRKSHVVSEVCRNDDNSDDRVHEILRDIGSLDFILEDTDVIGIRIPTLYKALYKTKISSSKRKRELFKIMVCKLIEELSNIEVNRKIDINVNLNVNVKSDTVNSQKDFSTTIKELKIKIKDLKHINKNLREENKILRQKIKILEEEKKREVAALSERYKRIKAELKKLAAELSVMRGYELRQIYSKVMKILKEY